MSRDEPGLALLFAPEPGEELRHDVAEKLSEVRHKLGNGEAALPRVSEDAPTRNPTSQ